MITCIAFVSEQKLSSTRNLILGGWNLSEASVSEHFVNTSSPTFSSI